MTASPLRLLEPPPITKPSLTPAPPAETSPVLLLALSVGLIIGLLASLVADHRLGALEVAVGDLDARLGRVEAGR